MNYNSEYCSAARGAFGIARVTLASVFAMAFAMASHAGLRVPYTTDAHTLHLWHLDESSGVTAADAVPTGGITLTNIGWPTPGGPPYTNTTLGAPSFEGMGNCVSSINKGHVLHGGVFTDYAEFRNQESGAFTFEAVVKFDTSPLGAIDAEIVCGDREGALDVRGWQWRIFNGVMEWNTLAGSGNDDFKSPLPAVGADAAITGAWYHVAVTFSGSFPTNGDTPNLLKFYWTALDPNRTTANQLGEFTLPRPLDGNGTGQPRLGVGGSARAITGNVGNNEGLIGSIDEVRISSVARPADQMAFMAGGAANPPEFTRQPPANVLAGYGRTLTIPALVSGTLPLHFQWQRNGLAVPGQNDTTLVVSLATFAAAGDYRLVVTNAYGGQTSEVAQVTIGATASGLFNTGLDRNGVLSAGSEADPHWTLFRSSDPMLLGPATLIFENSFPLQFASEGAFSPTNGISMWMGAGGNIGGGPITSPAGEYVYRARFLLDSVDPATFTMGGNLWVNGSIGDILVNGQSTGVALAPGGTLYVTTFSLTNGFVPGWNTVDFVETLGGAGISALRVEVDGVGLALPAGAPVITEQPASQTVRNASVAPGSSAAFSVVASGRPPLSYQWWADGAPLAGATNRTLTFPDPTTGAQGANFRVVVSNDSGSVTSAVAVLTLAPSNQAPVPVPMNLVAFSGQAINISLSELVQSARDPDHDPVSFVSADAATTNAAPYGTNNVEQVNATLVYRPVENYVGTDQFSYTIGDLLGENASGVVRSLVLARPASQTIVPGGTAAFGVGLSSIPAGYTFQWQRNGVDLAGAVGTHLTINNAQVSDAGTYRLEITDQSGRVWFSPNAGLMVGSPGTGTGLMGNYYDYGNGTTNFTGLPILSRIDPGIDLNFGADAPDPAVPTDLFMVRWHGQVQPLYDDTYTFYTTTDDGARLWVNGKLLVNRWQNQGATTVSGTIPLTANQKYDLVLEYYENTSVASAQLSWSSPHQAQEIIPAAQLYPGEGLLRPRLEAGPVTGTNLSLNWAGTFTLQSASALNGPWSTVAPSAVGPYSVPLGSSQQMFFRLVDPVAP